MVAPLCSILDCIWQSNTGLKSFRLAILKCFYQMADVRGVFWDHLDCKSVLKLLPGFFLHLLTCSCFETYLQSSFLFLSVRILLARLLGVQSYHKGKVKHAQRLPVNMSITNYVKVETLLREFICELLTYITPLRGYFICGFYFFNSHFIRNI